MLEEKLGDSPFNEDTCLKEMVNAFEKRVRVIPIQTYRLINALNRLLWQTKRLFDGDQALNVIQFGNTRDNDRAYGIVKGKLTLTGEEVSRTFEATVTRTVDSCLRLLRGRKVQVSQFSRLLHKYPMIRSVMRSIIF
jgi:hypothetical protein